MPQLKAPACLSEDGRPPVLQLRPSAAKEIHIEMQWTLCTAPFLGGGSRSPCMMESLQTPEPVGSLCSQGCFPRLEMNPSLLGIPSGPPALALSPLGLHLGLAHRLP